MIFVVRFCPEIIIKSREVRRRYIRILRRSLRTQSALINPDISVVGEWDNLEVFLPDDDPASLEPLVTLLCHTPGIALVMQVSKAPLPDLDGIAAETLKLHGPLLDGKTFAVRCKRTGQHPWNSMDVERYVGAFLQRNSKAAGVDLRKPDVVVKVEIHHDEMFVVERSYKGLGGYPLGTQDDVLSLISGGFDSSVSSFMCIRRGLVTHYCFFRLGGKEHELAVKEVALYLWMKFASSHRVKFITVPFEAVMDEMAAKLEVSQRGVVLKRMMMRAASRIAAQLNIEALVTGESVAQVASQTLANLAVIDAVTDRVILRPLIVTDKQDIIDTARRIGTEEFSRHIPEYCGAVTVRPTTRARVPKILEQEALFDFDILERAIADAQIQMIDRVMEGLGRDAIVVEEVEVPAPGACIVDIRHPDDVLARPLNRALHNGVSVIEIPFYALHSRFSELAESSQYLLYCEKGMMSRLHASHLRAAGHTNVGLMCSPALLVQSQSAQWSSAENE